MRTGNGGKRTSRGRGTGTIEALCKHEMVADWCAWCKGLTSMEGGVWASFYGKCASCGEGVWPGDEITRYGKGWKGVACCGE